VCTTASHDSPRPVWSPTGLGVENLKKEREAGRLIECLDDGFIRLVDYMGGDQAVVQAARVSYGDGNKKVSDDRGLVRYLLRHWHTTPLEKVELKFHVRVPMDCWRQWIRHRTASVNEYSTRYSEAIDIAQGRAALDLHRGVLESRSSQPVPLPAAEVGFACSA